MSAEETSIYSEKCRLCLDNPGVMCIFQNQDLQHDIFACTGVKVFSSCKLPEKICSKCSEIVGHAKELRLLAIENDKKLKMLLRNDEDDDDSRDTVCLENISVEESLPEPEVMIQENMVNCSDDTNNSENEIVPIKKRKLKIRKDLFDDDSGDLFSERDTTSTINTVKVKNKEDYERLKKQIRYDPDLSVIYECETCEKQFDTYKKLYLHIRFHNKKINCPLDACGKMFATNGDLEKHLRTHTGVRPFTCTICDKSFTQQGTLRVHKETVHYCFTVP